jgi:glycosyltransferase involved in cell wall biosynthesis
MPSKRVKILFTETYTHAAGGQRGLIDLVTHLDKAEFEPVVMIQGPGKLQEELDRNCIRHVTRRMEPFKNRWLPFSWCIGVGSVVEVIKAEKPDLVHSNHLYVGRYSGRAAHRLRIPCLVTLRLVHEPEIWDHYNRWETVRIHDRIVANSDEGRHVFESDPLVKTKIMTIKNGMDLERFRPVPDRAGLRCKYGAQYAIDEKSVVITQIASMVPQKGNEDLTREFLALAKDNNDLHLFLVGGEFAGTDNSKVIRAMAEAAGIGNRVHLTNYVWNVSELLNLTDISVLASREREGLPRSIIEAMACGNPVIATDVGGSKELVRDGETGFLVQPRDGKALREALVALIVDAKRRKAMGECALKLARENHDIRSMILKYQNVYRELLLGAKHGHS